ncbi:MAG TPA: MFS transporter, partial [Chloroflexi bacterium]|nr:MFS transporter [Chloroflexota bacterium]
GLGRSLWWILPGALINAVGYTMLRLASSAYIGDRSTPASQTRLVGIYATFGDIGSAVGPLFGYWLITFSSLDGVFLVSALLYALCLPFLMRLAKINQPKTEPLPS